MKKLAGIVVFGVIIGIVVAWLLFLRPTFLDGPTSYIKVTGESMQPTLNGGDLAIVRERAGYKVGDVIAFRADGGIVIHRIVGGDAEQGFTVQGDNQDTTDAWAPKPENILGAMWFYVPLVGYVFDTLQEPFVLSAIFGGLAVVTFVGADVRRRRRLAAQPYEWLAGAQPVNIVEPEGQAGSFQLAIVALLITSGLTIAAAAAAFYSLREPAHEQKFAETASYEQTAKFDYVAHMEPSTLYPSGLVRPTDSERQPLYTKLAQAIDVLIDYNFTSPHATDVDGSMTAELTVSAKDGWSKTQPLAAAKTFEGASTSAVATVNLRDVMNLIDTVENETGVKAASYEVSVSPTFQTIGNVNSTSISETFTPSFRLDVNRSQITTQSDPIQHSTNSIGSMSNEKHYFEIPGGRVSVATARVIASAATIAGILASVTFAAIVFLGAGRSEAERIRARYGSKLVSVVSADVDDGARWIRVGSIKDLARLVENDREPIFYRSLGTGETQYFVVSRSLIYEYRLAPRVRERRPQRYGSGSVSERKQYEGYVDNDYVT